MVTAEQKRSSLGARTYLPIEDYGIIGDLHTVALVGKNGSIDWYCLPAFDAPSVFGALLDAEKGGYFQITPQNLSSGNHKQLYLPDTNILVTRFLAETGVGEVTDFMPIQQATHPTDRHGIVRAVHVVNGTLTFNMTCRPAFNYARDPHTVEGVERGMLFRSASLNLGLFSTVALEEDGHGGARASFSLGNDEWAYFVLTSAQVTEEMEPYRVAEAYQKVLTDTRNYWHRWLKQCSYQGRWREMVSRSALTLKLLTYAPTGAVVAAPTTSLPEGIGGERNWDYRFTWLRDAGLTLQSLSLLGFQEEANAFTDWLLGRFLQLQPDQPIQPMFTIAGGTDMPEITLDHLDGYRQSRPVRIGNGAAKQLQMDVFGELFDALSLLIERRGMYYRGWRQIDQILAWLSKNWQTPDRGIWEVRGDDKIFVHSRLMCWVAFDRAIHAMESQGLPAPLEQWRKIRDTLYQEIMEKGWSEEKQSFVQYYGGDAIDASSLLISLTGFTAPTDPRMLKTLDRIQRELTHAPHVYRYRADQAADDGLSGVEGTFSICSFWMIEALTRAGKLAEARENLEQMFTYANHLGLYSEEIGPTGEAEGNFPQAFTHLALIRACYFLNEALKD
ncbi:MAG TPA: glycoside hydrolase family 15 protein [Ktedonobacteraceae bacterium]|nr:glycoside hydrolase family 15 protein [Ktedonobacteraceae bacterium]